MANAWRREPKPSAFLSIRTFLLLAPTFLLLLLLFFHLRSPPPPTLTAFLRQSLPPPPFPSFPTPIPYFDCHSSPQASPVVASLVEGLRHPFLYSLADFGSLPDKPHRNIARLLKGKPFRRPSISSTLQDILLPLSPSQGLVLDVGANVGMASFAAAALGFRVLAFEPVPENLQRLCDGVYLNRAADRVALFAAAVSDHGGNITIHKLVGRLDNSAVSAVGAKLAFKSNEEIEIHVASIRLDDMIPESEPVLLIKIDVQGWEYHVLRGASKLLSRKAGVAPYLIYEEDERLLQASNSTREQIKDFLNSMGYHNCTRQGTDAHCTKG